LSRNEEEFLNGLNLAGREKADIMLGGENQPLFLQSKKWEEGKIVRFYSGETPRQVLKIEKRGRGTSEERNEKKTGCKLRGPTQRILFEREISATGRRGVRGLLQPTTRQGGSLISGGIRNIKKGLRRHSVEDVEEMSPAGSRQSCKYGEEY